MGAITLAVAMDLTGKRVWSLPQYDVTTSDLRATASDLVFAGGNENYYALDGKGGTPLRKANLGALIVMALITFAIAGWQYLSVVSGNVMATLALS